MQRIGVSLVPHPTMTIPEYVQMAQLAEEQGYEQLWAGETNGLELFTFLGVLLSQTSRIKVGPGVASIFTRTPTFLTMQAATFHAIAPHRTILGLGVSTRIIVSDWHGVPWDHPLERTAEYVDMVRQGLRGERLTYEGRFYRSHNFRLSLPAPGAVPIYLAAVNTRMLRLAGAIADGVLLTWVPLTSVGDVVAEIRAGAEAAGRDPDAVDIALYLRTCVTDDQPSALEWLRRDITGYTVADVYSRAFRRFGFAAEVDAMQEAWNQGDRERAKQQITDHMVDALGIIGPAEMCREKVAQFVDAGIDVPVILPFTPDAVAVSAYAQTIRAFRG